ncbi:MAG TPA: hypothetical protein VF131_17105 [Blastocatellia bacterium]|nr:hypothetical protein [Blastocatellia bacterium]
MIVNIVALRFLSIALAFCWPATALSQQSKVIELVANDGRSKIASIHLNDQNLLFESSDNLMSFLFTTEAFFEINHKDKSYRVQSYDELHAMASRKVDEIAKSQESTTTGPNVEFRLTEEADTISGLRARKIIKINGGKPEAEIWVSSELVPMKLRAAGERIRAALPEGYWKKVQGNPGMVEIIMLYGIPLKMVVDGRDIYKVKMLDGSSSGRSLEVPSGYRKVGN